MPTLEKKLLDFYRTDPNQPRKEFPEYDLRRLGESLLVRQIEPLQAYSDGLLIDGERRYRAAKLVGLKSLDVIITDKKLNDTELLVVRLTSFFHKADLSGYEKYLACSELLCGNPNWQLKDLAEALKVEPSTVTKYLSPLKTTSAWQEALRDGKVGISDCYQASLLPEREQDALLQRKLCGASRDEIVSICRQKRKGGKPATKVSRVNVVLASGVQIIVTGREALGLDGYIDHLAEALKGSQTGARARSRCQNIYRLHEVQALCHGEGGASCLSSSTSSAGCCWSSLSGASRSVSFCWRCVFPLFG